MFIHTFQSTFRNKNTSSISSPRSTKKPENEPNIEVTEPNIEATEPNTLIAELRSKLKESLDPLTETFDRIEETKISNLDKINEIKIRRSQSVDIMRQKKKISNVTIPPIPLTPIMERSNSITLPETIVKKTKLSRQATMTVPKKDFLRRKTPHV
jgi:hypothetical protein